ncbi:MAG: hypothetical protein ABH803_02300 [Candidatus Micrarchaeota archaeon]
MKAELTSKSPDKAVVKLSGCSRNLVNALRRAIISDLPSFAISKVDVYENNTILYNEYLANRLGLIPLTFEEGIADDAEITFSLNAESIEENKTVYARELISSDDKIKVFCERIAIVKLGGKQKLRIEATATKGTAKQHSRYQNALASFELLDEKKGEYSMSIESFNNIPATKQFKKAIKILGEKTTELKKEL